MHGVALSIFNQGIILAGLPGIGKSQLALSLLDRGHALVSDDLICIEEQGGHCFASSIFGFEGVMAVRGVGRSP